MSGHSHWSKVKRAKGLTDARRGKLFSRLSKEIAVAAKMGGGDPSFNPRLRQAILTAKEESVPSENIERAIKKGTGELDGVSFEEIVYEGYASGGVAMIVEAATDNKNRTAAEVRAIFTKNHGNLAGAGSVAWMFHRKGLVTVDAANSTEDDVLGATLDAGVEDVRTIEGTIEVITPPDKLDAANEALKKTGITPLTARFTYIAETHAPVTDRGTAEQVLRLYEALDDHDDVQNVHANFDIPPELLAQISGV